MKHLIHSLKHFVGIDQPESQTSEKERIGILHYAKDKCQACEIGVFEGLNTASISKALDSHGQLFAIDPFFTGRLGFSYSKIIAQLHVKRHGDYLKVHWLEALSNECFTDVPDDLDFIFIDGDHSFEGITNDWIHYSPKIVKGGFILLHDSFSYDNSRSLGSHHFYDEVISNDDRFEFIERIDSMAVLQRK